MGNGFSHLVLKGIYNTAAKLVTLCKVQITGNLPQVGMRPHHQRDGSRIILFPDTLGTQRPRTSAYFDSTTICRLGIDLQASADLWQQVPPLLGLAKLL
ncbi:hypothetical protein Cadr_000009959 [Camelus dromedarius]|uniref:Uncharacterized protein n=1 Tax=Camelus dromedarius TaxID=9838 RepID=A0A5N4DW32_CAMDR|nr:hypothetical protein Cadr_000009959 [Camelus dromedarius]